MNDVVGDEQATPEEIQRARTRYAYTSSNDIEIDDGAAASRGDNGLWVAAWVWLHDPDPLEDKT
jgi:hypothetical protein